MSDDVIERYLRALVAGDWPTFADCLADDGWLLTGEVPGELLDVSPMTARSMR